MTREQEQLVLANVALADAAVKRLLRTLPSLDFELLRSIAYEALVSAALSYRPGRGSAFPSWAHRRVSGALIDYQRAMLGGRQGRAVERPRRVPSYALVSLEAPAGEDSTVSESIDCGLDLAALVSDRDLVERALSLLPARERFVVWALGRGYVGSEVAELLGVSEARISQMHTRASLRIRRVLDLGELLLDAAQIQQLSLDQLIERLQLLV